MEGTPQTLYTVKDRHGLTVSLRVLGRAEREVVERLRDADEEALLEALLAAGVEDLEPLPEEETSERIDLLEALLTLDEDEWQGELFAQALDLDWVPRWWSERGGCTHPENCPCGPRTLREAIEHLSASERALALTAHLQLLSTLAEHHRAASGLGDGELTGMVCVGCLADVDAHLEALDEALAAAGRELGEAVASGIPVVRIQKRRAPSEPPTSQ